MKTEPFDTPASDQSEPWAEPVNMMSELSAPPLQAADMPPCLGEYARQYSVATGFDTSMCLAAALSVAAAALSDGFQIVADSESRWFQQPRLWILTVGRPGAGKTPAQREMLSPLWNLQKTLREAHAREIASWPEDSEAKKPPPPKLIVSDTTIEALSEVLRENPRGVLVATDEFESWLGSLDAYRKGGVSRDRGEWLRVFDGGPHTIERVQRGSLYVENWGASILTATTPAALAKLTRQLPEDGLMQRFIPILAKSRGEPGEASKLEPARKAYTDTIERLFHAVPRAHNGCVPMALETASLFREWLRKTQLRQEALGALEPALEAHFAKHPTLLLRILLTFHCANIVNMNPERPADPACWQVPVSTLELAIRFLDRAGRHAIALYLGREGGSEAYELTREVAKAILAHDYESLERRQLVQKVRAFRSARPDLQDATLRMLVDLGWLRFAEGGYMKALPARYDVNPKLRERFAELAERERERRAVVREMVRDSSALSRAKGQA